MIIPVNLGLHSYSIHLERGCIQNASSIFQLNRKVLIVTDSGVPNQYSEEIQRQCQEAYKVVLPQGETSKSMDNYCLLLREMLENHFDRSDCVVAVGGGVVGDLAGFAASCYMRGIDFYNVPTTLLSQVDSSIGGKTAVDFQGVKNIVGTFWQPKAVLIDPDVLQTLEERQVTGGLAEVIKMAATSDAELFRFLEETDSWKEHLDKIIEKALLIKKNVVEKDERESGLRRILNFGHTLGHGIESEQDGALLHGECVALGMLPMSSANVRKRLVALYEKFGLPKTYSGDTEKAMEAIRHDKKSKGGEIRIVEVPEIGTFQIRSCEMQELKEKILTLKGDS